MDFYIKNSKRNMTMTLPITPEKYEIEYKIDMETVRLTNFGDINIPTNHTPITLQIEGLFSVNKNHYLNQQTLNNIQHPMDYVGLITNWINNKDIVRVVITKDMHARIDTDFHIESIKHVEDGETIGDIKYTIILREYRPLKTNTTTTKKNNKPPRTTTKNKSNTTKNNKKRNYVVQKGDYLGKIARKFYGDAGKWTVIYNSNKKAIGKNPNSLKVGQRLVIP